MKGKEEVEELLKNAQSAFSSAIRQWDKESDNGNEPDLVSLQTDIDLAEARGCVQMLEEVLR